MSCRPLAELQPPRLKGSADGLHPNSSRYQGQSQSWVSLCKWDGVRGTPGGRAALVLQALEAVARVSKGFGLALCTRQRPALGDLLAAPLQAAIRIPQVRMRLRSTIKTRALPAVCELL